MSQRLALFIGTALVGGLGYLALNHNDADATDSNDDINADDSDEEEVKTSGKSWWGSFMTEDDVPVADETKISRRKSSGGAKSKKHRVLGPRKTRQSRK
jgi:hypothetical protein